MDSVVVDIPLVLVLKIDDYKNDDDDNNNDEILIMIVIVMAYGLICG
jgi:hypothetical protein